MKLLSLHQDFKYNSIRKALASKCVYPLLIDLIVNDSAGAKQQPSKFWTSGTDLGCEGNFGYCSTNRLLRNEAKYD
jgi:hypothetical protein